MTAIVIIPVKDRAEIQRCVDSLVPIDGIDHVLICDGGSSEPACIAALNALNAQPKVRVVPVPQAGFNKAKLMNRGIQQAIATHASSDPSNPDVLLISDADIVWNAAAIEQLLATVTTQPNTIACIHTVVESVPHSVAVRRDRYTYAIHLTTTEARVEVLPALPNSDQRPGCGLMCAETSTWLKVGGYKELFYGWGWEDQDLLMRATLLGISIQAIGCVTHLSHGDIVRNQHCDRAKPSDTRDRNIVVCLNSLAQGQLLGDLAMPKSPAIPSFSRSISVCLPPSLIQC